MGEDLWTRNRTFNLFRAENDKRSHEGFHIPPCERISYKKLRAQDVHAYFFFKLLPYKKRAVFIFRNLNIIYNKFIFILTRI